MSTKCKNVACNEPTKVNSLHCKVHSSSKRCPNCVDWIDSRYGQKNTIAIVPHVLNNYSLMTHALKVTLMKIKFATSLMNTLLALFIMLTFTHMLVTAPIEDALTTLHF